VKTSRAGGHGGPCDDSGRADMAISVLFPPAIRDEQQWQTSSSELLFCFPENWRGLSRCTAKALTALKSAQDYADVSHKDLLGRTEK